MGNPIDLAGEKPNLHKDKGTSEAISGVDFGKNKDIPAFIRGDKPSGPRIKSKG